MTTSVIIRDALVWDNHGCMPLRPFDEAFLPQLDRYRSAGVDVIFLNVGFGEQGVEEHVRMLAHFRRWLSLNSDRYQVIGRIGDIEEARRTGKLAVGFDIEGMNAVADQPSLVQLYYDLGVRWMLIAYNRNNRAGGGCQDEDTGLTDFGRRIIDEMTRVGMVLCCSHAGARTAREAIDYSPDPVIFSHSNPAGIWPHERNVSDELLRACASRGGVVEINGLGPFLGDNDNRVETLVRHIEYAVELVGEDHVGLGLDYVFDTQELDDYVAAHPELFPPERGYGGAVKMVAPEALGQVVEELTRIGFGDDALRKILGGNFLRIAQHVWR